MHRAPFALNPSTHSAFIDEVADSNTLREAWYRVQRAGRAPGVDRMTIEMFRAHADRRLRALSDGLQSRRYRSSPLLRVNIPKPAGGWRALGIPTITDRVAQSAAAIVVHERIAALYSNRSFAYRPFLGPRRAALFLKNLIAAADWAVTADIDKFFDNVDHQILSDQLRGAGFDPDGIKLLVMWLVAPVHDQGQRYQPLKGLPQGSPIAPVLANLYLSGFDATLEADGFTHVRYADDFVVLASDESDAARALQYVRRYLEGRLRLHIKAAKTQTLPTRQGVDFVGYRFTRADWTLPPEAESRLRSSVEAILQPSASRALPILIKQHNDLIRGWRHYYFGNSPEMDAQLVELDGWRQEACRKWLESAGIQAPLADAWFERLVSEATLRPGAYGDWTDGARDRVEDDGQADGADLWHERREDNDREDSRFSTTASLRAAEIGRSQKPLLFDDGWLRVPTFGAYVARSKQVLIVRRKKQVIFEVAFDDVSAITIEGAGVVLSAAVVHECVARTIALSFARPTGQPVARLLAVRPALHATELHRQVAARSTKTGSAIVVAILSAKLANQRALLLYHWKYPRRAVAVRAALLSAAQAIARCGNDLRAAETLPLWKVRRRFFLVEARAAAHYWGAFASILPTGLCFDHRTHQNASDPINKALNYGYGILAGHVWTAVHRAGLEPAIGLLHSGRRRTNGLVFDVMEPFRQPVVDRAVLALVGRGWLPKENQDGQLTLRTRAALHRAISNRLNAGKPRTLAQRIRMTAVTLRRALARQGPYIGYRMTW